MANEKGRSIQRLAQILATLASGFFLVFGVMITIWEETMSASFRFIDLRGRLSSMNYLNDTQVIKISNHLANSSSKLAHSSIDIMGYANFFLVLASVLATASLVVWFWAIQKYILVVKTSQLFKLSIGDEFW